MNGLRNSLRGDSGGQTCVLLTNTMAHKLLVGSNGVSKGDEQKYLLLGLLAKVLPYQLGTEDVPLQIISDLSPEPIDENIWLVKKHLILPVLPCLVNAFMAIGSTLGRVELVKNELLCKELAKIQVGSKVLLHPENGDPDAHPEIAVVQYIGPIPNFGTAHFYGLVLTSGSRQGTNNGTLYKKRYFSCAKDQGVFATINRIHPYIYQDAPEPPMQVNKESNEASNYRTTLVLHLKEKENMARLQPSRVERTEKLIDVDPHDPCPLSVGDRVVWVNDDTGPERGTVRWAGVLSGRSDQSPLVGVEFDNPVGNGSGMYCDEWLFKTKLNHASFIPITGLLREDDFFCKPQDTGSKQNRSKLSGKLVDQCDLLSSKVPTSWESDQASRGRHSEPIVWTSARVKLPDYSDSIAKHSLSSSREAQTAKQDDGNICRSEYIFTTPFPNINATKNQLENSVKQTVKDGKNTTTATAKKPDRNLSSYPIGATRPNDLYPLEKAAPSHRRRTDIVIGGGGKSSEAKIRHSYSQDSQHRESVDLTDFVEPWSVENSYRTRDASKAGGFNGLAEVVNDNDAFGLEVIGEGLHTLAVSSQGNNKDPPDFPVSPNLSNSSDGSNNYYDTPAPAVDLADPVDLGVGSVVEVAVNNEPHYGVIRWIGVVPEDRKNRRVAGIEMEEEIGSSDGTFNARRYFQCNPKKALFVGLNQCQKDGRFQDLHPHSSDNKAKSFGPDECSVIPGAVKPQTVCKKEDMDAVCGKYKGIQGHHNSCYLDATLFSMFAFTSAFDSLLFRPRAPKDVPRYEEVQRVLREEIVNPLRRNQFCKWDRVMKLRTLLENHSSVTGLTSEEKDPEEFLTSLVAQVLHAKPFLKLSSGQEAYHYQLFVEKDEHLHIPTVQQLFEQSFLASDIKLKEVPSCLIIQMPRFGKSYKMYPRIFPSQLLDVTDIIEDSPRQCTVCGKHAEFECKECFGKSGMGGTLDSISFCANCLDTAHSHKMRSCHKYRKLSVPVEYSILQECCQIPRLYMQLFAVVCIETSHYVSFVKCGSDLDSPWCFFDSMADRKGEQNGYNIPEVVSCPNLPYWLSEDGQQQLSAVKDDRQLPEHAKRLLCDAYMCMYQSTEMMMYR